MKTLTADDSGSTSIEYGLIAGMISIVILAAITTTGSSIGGLYDSIAAQVVAALSAI